MSRFLLVFDLDGTLVDSAPDLRAAIGHAVAAPPSSVMNSRLPM